VDAHTLTKEAEKLKQTYARKLKGTLLCDRTNVLLVKFMQQGITVMSEVNCETHTKKKLCRAIQRHGMLTDGLVLIP
jgi:hypothetical protein